MHNREMQEVAQELLRAIRGTRSQVAFSRRLGYRSNVAADWEAGRRFPKGAEMLRACARTGVDVLEAMRRFAPAADHTLCGCGSAKAPSPQVLANWLDALRGQETITALAERTAISRYSVSRWLGGQTEPRLPDFLLILEALTARLVDFLSRLVPIGQMPSIRREQNALAALKELAFREPWTEAILRILETKSYQLALHEDAWIAQVLGIAADQVERCIHLLEAARVIEFRTHRFYLRDVVTLDTTADRKQMIAHHTHWNEVARERALDFKADGLLGYNVFVCSSEDFQRIKALQRAFFHSVRQVVASSGANERVGLIHLCLREWSLDEQ